ncbi:MAG: hypothetical protein KTR31_07585 [Myxococcales bacterium]|nr:hypothetical protein [Myxococcales bacterium]
MRISTLALLMASCEYEAPINDNPLSAPPLLNSIEGSVVFTGGDDTPLGPTYINAYDANNPGPPAGTGAPVTFSSVPAGAYSGIDAGLRTADYGLSQMPNGEYIVNALMDVDGNFNPFVSVLAGATCGDWVGTYLDDLGGTPATVPLQGGVLRSGVTVFVAQPVPTQRPAFEYVSDTTISLGETTTNPIPRTFRLGATTINTAFSPEQPLFLGPSCPVFGKAVGCETTGFCPCDPAIFSPASPTFEPCPTAIYLQINDLDQDGEADPYPAPLQAANGLLDIWPRVFLEFVGAPLGTFQFDGQILPERWVSEAFPLAAEIGGAALYGQPPSAVAPIGTPVPVNDLNVTFLPVFLHYHAGGVDGVDANGPFDVVNLLAGGSADLVPQGAWATTMISFTGQTWTVPNEISQLNLPGIDGFDPLTQGGAVVIAP